MIDRIKRAVLDAALWMTDRAIDFFQWLSRPNK